MILILSVPEKHLAIDTKHLNVVLSGRVFSTEELLTCPFKVLNFMKLCVVNLLKYLFQFLKFH